MRNKIQLLAEKIEKASSIIVLSGAGMGVDSGLPDFRGKQGFWNAYPLYKNLGVRFEEMANPAHFARDPSFAWGFYGHRLNSYRETKPHKGFTILLDIFKKYHLPYFCVTSNVDGHFQKAGFADENMYEVHGSIHHLQCSNLCSQEIWKNDIEIEINFETMRSSAVPKCKHCNGVARPNILMFGDFSFLSSRCNQQEGRFSAFLTRNSGKSPVLIEMGAGTAVPTIRYIAERTAAQIGGLLARINPREPQMGIEGISIADGALNTLQSIAKILL